MGKAEIQGWSVGVSESDQSGVLRRSLRSSVCKRYTAGIERPWCVDKLPSHISKTVVSTVGVGGPERTELSPSQKSDVLKVVDFRVSASADMTIFSDVFSS